jgi:hypothetical protein
MAHPIISKKRAMGRRYMYMYNISDLAADSLTFEVHVASSIMR